jgi:DNA-binding response OmpR family regulator
MIVPERLRLLLVEDDDDLIFIYKQKLERDEYQVDVAPDGKQALRMAASVDYDLIFLDIRLPNLDGFAVLEKLRARKATRHTPVVILSNLGQAELGARGQRLGALEFLIKSKTPDQLAEQMESWSLPGGARGGLTGYAQAG